jgi:hypothetical protein
MTPQCIEIDEIGSMFYFKDKEMKILHREDGPAVEYADGDKAWYLNGEIHREDGPAVEYADGSKFWYLNGVRHREDGPAIEWSNGSKSWYLNDVKYTEEAFKKRTAKEIVLTLDEIAAKFGIEVSKLKIAK